MGKQNKWEYKVEKEGFSDKEKEKGGGSLRQVYYNIYDYGHLIGSHTTADIQTMIHCSRQIPEHCAAEGRSYRGRYTFERLGDYSDVKAGDLAAEWDKVRLQILHGGKSNG